MARSLITSLGGRVAQGNAAEPAGEWTPAPWPTLKGFPYEEGATLPPEIKALDGKEVKAWGYLIQLEADQYLLVQSLWSCCFGQPPDINEAVVVRTHSDVSQYESQGAQVYGRFEASESYEEGFVTSLYRLDASHVLPL